MALCSCNEGGPRLTADAMACEVPTITTPVGVMPEIVREGSSMPLMIWRAVYVRFWRTRPWPSGSALLVVRACIPGPGTNAPGPFSNSFISAVHRSSVPIEPPSSAAPPGDGKPRPPWRFEYRLQPLPASARSAPEEKVRKPLRDGGASRGEARSRPKFCTNSCERYYIPT